MAHFFLFLGQVEFELPKETGSGIGRKKSPWLVLSKTNIHGSLLELILQDERGKKMATTTLKREEIIQKAEKKGRMALVDPVPDPTEAGKAMWIQNIREYFTEVCDSMVNEYNAQDMRGDILAGLERGFEEVIRKQPEMDVPVEEALSLFRGVFKEIH